MFPYGRHQLFRIALGLNDVTLRLNCPQSVLNLAANNCLNECFKFLARHVDCRHRLPRFYPNDARMRVTESLMTGKIQFGTIPVNSISTISGAIATNSRRSISRW
jgi:hypothetical protein